MTAIEQINQIAGDMQGYLTGIRVKSRKKFIGVMHAVVPQEILYAAGLHPFRLFPLTGEPIDVANAHLHVSTSSTFRAIWDQVLKGRYPFLDGVVLPESCETVTYFARGWAYHRPDDFVTPLPGVRFNKTQNALQFFCNELDSLAKTMVRFTGTKISEDSLTHAITVYNKNRKFLRRIYELRKSESPPLSGVDALNILMVSHIMDKEENNRLLERLLSELKNRTYGSGPKARLMVSGPCITDVRLLGIMEASGAVVVTDDSNFGTRSFWHSVDSEQNHLMALARAYSTVPCPFSTSVENRLTYISKMVTEYGVDGVVFAIERACESEKMDFPYLEKEIRNKVGVPVTFVETEYLCDMAPIRTRIDAFVESLMK